MSSKNVEEPACSLRAPVFLHLSAVQMLMPPQYVLGTADMVKTAFAGEVDGTVTVAPANMGGSRE
jgi:hypothetical protein